MARGGKREGSGRKAREWTPLRDLVSSKDKAEYVEFVLSTYKESPDLTKWLGNQLYGQAPQSIDHTTKGEKLPTPILTHVKD